MGISFSNTVILVTTEQTLGKIGEKQIPDTVIAFRDMYYKHANGICKPLYPLNQYCQICGKSRFNEEEVSELSSANLTHKVFNAKYKRIKYANKAMCDVPECEMGYLKLFGSFTKQPLGVSFYFDKFK